MARLNSDGVDRSELLIVLRNARAVASARQRGRCLLCRGAPVNRAGLCEGCTANLSEEELAAARPYIEGPHP